MVASGDWLVPRMIATADGPFLEKPPLKFWMVAFPIRAGWLPADEFGLRFWDALFGAASFVYVFLIGAWLLNPLCGFISVLLLFAHAPLLFSHGLRSNTMDSALVLAYCGGIYHYLRWIAPFVVRTFERSSEGERTTNDKSGFSRTLHVFAVALYFVLGFMTKFVAALFLPAILGLTALRRPGASARPGARLADLGARRRVRGRADRSVVRVRVAPVRQPFLADDRRRARLRAVHVGARSGTPPSLALLSRPGGRFLGDRRPDPGRWGSWADRGVDNAALCAVGHRAGDLAVAAAGHFSRHFQAVSLRVPVPAAPRPDGRIRRRYRSGGWMGPLRSRAGSCVRARRDSISRCWCVSRKAERCVSFWRWPSPFASCWPWAA